ncbi:MAG: hypothetical protein ACPG49_08535 [Chitinophagales bacterium]
MDILQSGQFLSPNQQLSSPNGVYSLIFQTDGNVVLYENNKQAKTRQAKWNTGTSGTDANQLKMQADGNLVLYSGATPPKMLWSSRTNGKAGSQPFLKLQDDGNLVIYGVQAFWSSNTNI